MNEERELGNFLLAVVAWQWIKDREDVPMSERLNDADAKRLLPLMVELADIVQPAVADRLRFALKHDAVVRQVTVERASFDLVALARFVDGKLSA